MNEDLKAVLDELEKLNEAHGGTVIAHSKTVYGIKVRLKRSTSACTASRSGLVYDAAMPHVVRPAIPRRLFERPLGDRRKLDRRPPALPCASWTVGGRCARPGRGSFAFSASSGSPHSCGPSPS